MAVKMTLRDPVPFSELRAKIKNLGIALTENQISFLKEHDGHANIHIEGDRVFCRTCNMRDQ